MMPRCATSAWKGSWRSSERAREVDRTGGLRPPARYRRPSRPHGRCRERRWPLTPAVGDGEEEGGGDVEGEGEPEDKDAAVEANPEAGEAKGVAKGSDEPPSDPPSDDDPETPPSAEPDSLAPRPQSYAEMVERWGGLTPLLHAVRQGHKEAAVALLEVGADVNLPSAGDGTTPLLMAALNGQFDLATTLLERGADPNAVGVAGITPLFATLERQWAPRASYAHPTAHRQQQTNHLELLAALLRAGADPNVRLTSHLWFMEYTFGVLRGSGIHLEGATPFWRAAYALDVEAMRLLKDHGADPNIPTVKPPERRRRPVSGA